jgi:hypothetical protein
MNNTINHTRDQAEDTLSDEQLLKVLARLDRFARLNDSQFRIPFTRIRIGLDAIIGLVPFVGETIGLILSLYLLMEAGKLNVPLRLKLRMIANVIVDWLIGLVPVLGDLADIAFKANDRNMKLLKAYLQSEQARRVTLTQSSSKKPVLIYVLLSVLLLAGTVYLSVQFNVG